MSHHYTAIYLPVDKPLTDGCVVIDQSGKHSTYHAELDNDNLAADYLRHAELFLVEYEFNQMKVVGRPYANQSWIQAGMQFKKCEANIWRRQVGWPHNIVSVSCPTCGHNSDIDGC